MPSPLYKSYWNYLHDEHLSLIIASSSASQYLYMEEVEDAEALNGEDCYDGDKDGNDDDTDDEEQTSCLTEKYFESEEKLAMVA